MPEGQVPEDIAVADRKARRDRAEERADRGGDDERRPHGLASRTNVGPSARTFQPSSRSATASGFPGVSNTSRTSYFARTSFQLARSSTASRYSRSTAG